MARCRSSLPRACSADQPKLFTLRGRLPSDPLSRQLGCVVANVIPLRAVGFPCHERWVCEIAGVMSFEDFADSALFIDLDGTLIDIAPAPDRVVIPSGLADLLETVARRLEGAFAIVTGRPIAEVDRWLSPLKPIAAGIHGAELRATFGGEVVLRAEPLDAAVIAAVRKVVTEEPGTIFELKPASVAVHYRQVPEAEPRVESALRNVLDGGPKHLILCRGRKVFEIVPRHVSKGAALATIMGFQEFRGRRPIMIGDDLSDISAIEAAVRLGGRGLTVAGEQFGSGDADFANPEAVRRWLAAEAGSQI